MSERRRALIVDAFTEEPLAGNPAGVVPEAEGLAAEQMQAIAREINASETAFVLAADRADRRVRYFTPETEVDLCGHATIATHHHLRSDGEIGTGTHSLETRVGVLTVEVEADGTVWLTQEAPEVREVAVERERVADALGIDPGVVIDDLPIAWATTGVAYLVVPIEFLEDLGEADPTPDAVERLTDEHDATGVYAFTFDTLAGDSTLHARMFAPGAGIPEDPVTGTASGAAGGYLQHVGAFDESPEEMIFEQGHYLDRPGRVRVRGGTEVRVGGSAVEALDGEIRVPERGDDEIIEAS